MFMFTMFVMFVMEEWLVDITPQGLRENLHTVQTVELNLKVRKCVSIVQVHFNYNNQPLYIKTAQIYCQYIVETKKVVSYVIINCSILLYNSTQLSTTSLSHSKELHASASGAVHILRQQLEGVP